MYRNKTLITVSKSVLAVNKTKWLQSTRKSTIIFNDFFTGDLVWSVSISHQVYQTCSGSNPISYQYSKKCNPYKGSTRSTPKHVCPLSLCALVRLYYVFLLVSYTIPLFRPKSRYRSNVSGQIPDFYFVSGLPCFRRSDIYWTRTRGLFEELFLRGFNLFLSSTFMVLIDD